MVWKEAEVAVVDYVEKKEKENKEKENEGEEEYWEKEEKH